MSNHREWLSKQQYGNKNCRNTVLANKYMNRPTFYITNRNVNSYTSAGNFKIYINILKEHNQKPNKEIMM